MKNLVQFDSLGKVVRSTSNLQVDNKNGFSTMGEKANLISTIKDRICIATSYFPFIKWYEIAQRQ